MQTEFKPFNPDEGKEIYRVQLPHWRQPGVTYFTTWRLADSLPQMKLRQLEELRTNWLRSHKVANIELAPEGIRNAYHRQFTAKMHQWLDAGYGSCELKKPDCAEIVSNALRFFDGTRYALDEFVVMPNHVHALFAPSPDYTLAEILHSWKSFTSHAINKQLNCAGVFWLNETWDHIVRSRAHLEHFRNYIRENPSKARLLPNHYVSGRGVGILD